MPDWFELLMNKLEEEIVAVTNDLNTDYMTETDEDRLLGKKEGLELAIELVIEIENALVDFNNTVNGSGG